MSQPPEIIAEIEASTSALRQAVEQQNLDDLSPLLGRRQALIDMLASTTLTEEDASRLDSIRKEEAQLMQLIAQEKFRVESELVELYSSRQAHKAYRKTG